MFITCSVQLYLPPEYMMNKDFLKEVWAEDKALLRLDQVSRVYVPLYDELSVANNLADDEDRRKVHDVLPNEDG